MPFRQAHTPAIAMLSSIAMIESCRSRRLRPTGLGGLEKWKPKVSHHLRLFH